MQCSDYIHHTDQRYISYVGTIFIWLCHPFDVLFFFFQAEDGIRDDLVTGVQTCALPILDAAGDRLEVVDRERPRVEVAVPADDVERVIVEDVRLVPVANADLDRELTPVAVRVQLRRRMDVTVVVRRPFEQLPVLVAIPLRDLDSAGRLEYEVPLLAVGPEAVGGAAGDDDVIAFGVGDVAEDRLERAAPLVDEDHLVALAVPEVVLRALARPAQRNL